MYRVFIIKVDGTVTVTEQAKAPELKQLQDAVGGYIETVPYLTKFDGMTRGRCYVNENGIALGLPVNRKAMEVWKANVPNGDPGMMHLLGTVLFYAKVPSGATVGKKVAASMLCAFTFIQCSEHMGLQSGTWDGSQPKASYHGKAYINGKRAKQQFRLGNISGVTGNDKAFVQVK